MDIRIGMFPLYKLDCLGMKLDVLRDICIRMNLDL
jgi:hypothetical protein